MNNRRPVPLVRWEGCPVDDWERRWRLPLLRIYAETGSTNDEARALALEGAPAGTVIITDHQRTGRGREGRVWEDRPARSLLLSVVLRPRDPEVFEAAGPVPLRVGLAACAAIETCGPLRVRLKWPNDILALDGRKLGGILCEAVLGEDPFVVAGLGINVLQTDDEWPDHLAGAAASIRCSTGVTIRRSALAEALIDALRPFHVDSRELDPGERLELQRRDALIGTEVTVDGAVAGTASGIRADGALLVRTPDRLQAIRSGTVRTLPHREPPRQTSIRNSFTESGRP